MTDIGDAGQFPRDADRLRGLLAAVVESSDDAIVTKLLDGTITSWNAAAHRILGYSAAEIIGQPITRIIPHELHAEERSIIEQLNRGQRIEHYETVRIAKDGRRLHVELTISPIRNGGGAIVGASKILRDISERKRVEQALIDERRTLELLNNVGRALASNLELDALLQAVTDATTQLAGAEFGTFFYNAADADGQAYSMVSGGRAAPQALERFRQPAVAAVFAPLFESRSSLRCDDVQAHPQLGRWMQDSDTPLAQLPVRSCLAIPVVSRSQTVLGGLFFGHSRAAMFSERTQRLIDGVAAHAAVAIDNARLFQERNALLGSERAARAHAERLSASKDEFLATLSHELRTPLNAILGWAQILRRGTASPADLVKGLEVIERNVRAQTQLVDDLLDMSRIIAGHMRLDIQTVMPVAFVQAAVDALRPGALARGVSLETVLDPACGAVDGDPDRLQQVVWNLLSNAIKFTPRGGRIQVRLARLDTQAEISVADTGAGIRPELLPHVFERFRQGDASLTRRHGGLGLGLAIVKHIVDLHGGAVEVSSAGENRGAAFRVRLPLAASHRELLTSRRVQPKGPQAVSVAMAGADLSGLTILVVDDEPDARELIRRVLQDNGAQVLTAASAAEAICIVEKQPPTILVSDIGMPEVDGYELLRRIRALGADRGWRLPAIALTAFARSEDRTRALFTGYIAHVAKPVEPAEIVATVATVAGRTG